MTDEERIVARILDVIPPGSFELATFFSLFRVRFSDTVKTACVTCGESPELLLNRKFIETHCRTDEHLFMLVMHELYHVILGHTTLFPHPTELLNIVFDAVINAILCSLFPEPAFTSLFTDCYPSDALPWALLRPKGEGTPPSAEAALDLLYGGSDTGTYHDVYEALLASGCVKEIALELKDGDMPVLGKSGGGKPGEGDKDGDGGGKPLLLGSHGEEGDDLSQEMKDLINEAIAKWPSPDRPLCGRDLGAGKGVRDFGAEAPSDARLQRGLRQLMRQAAMPGLKEVRRRAVHERTVATATFLPDWHDRSHEARELAFGDALIYGTTARLKRPTDRDNRRTFVYFDVSGSVADEVPSVAQALLPYCRKGLCTVHVFSTEVSPASVRDLAARAFETTGGTDIDCVLRHVLDLPPRKRPRAAVVITDGFTGKPNAGLAKRFRASGMRLFVGLAKSSFDKTQERDLASIAEKFVRLF